MPQILVALSSRVLVACGNLSPCGLFCNTGIAPFSSNRDPCLFRDQQSGKPARHFRLEAEVTLWLRRAGV
jgi:hypothetical protein